MRRRADPRARMMGMSIIFSTWRHASVKVRSGCELMIECLCTRSYLKARKSEFCRLGNLMIYQYWAYVGLDEVSFGLILKSACCAAEALVFARYFAATKGRKSERERE